MSAFITLVARDLRLAARQGGALGTALGFYLIVVAMLPLGLGPDLNLLSRIAPGVLWIALLLSALLSLGRVFESDYEDGSLDVLATGPLPLELVAAAKAEGFAPGVRVDNAFRALFQVGRLHDAIELLLRRRLALVLCLS